MAVAPAGAAAAGGLLLSAAAAAANPAAAAAAGYLSVVPAGVVYVEVRSWAALFLSFLFWGTAAVDSPLFNAWRHGYCALALALLIILTSSSHHPLRRGHVRCMHAAGDWLAAVRCG